MIVDTCIQKIIICTCNRLVVHMEEDIG